MKNATIEKGLTQAQTVVSRFRECAKSYADETAVVFHNRRYSYREVDGLSDSLAAYVAALGLGREDVVSILIPRCEWMAIASLGVLKAGCAYQPLDPTYPKERLNFMMQDAGARLLIADEALRDLVDGYRGEVLLTRDIADLPTAEPTATDDIAPDSLFILLYTSGSTGVPKGCMLEHGNVTAFCDWYRRFYDLKRGDRVAAYASFGFDACMMDLYPALTTGAAVYIIPEEIRLDLIALNGYFESNGITHAFMTTQVGCQFAELENHSLRHLSVGGECFIPVVPPTNYQLYNAYGPTECTIFTTIYPVRQYEKNVPIGRPLDGCRLYVVDEQGRQVEQGQEGELWVSGPQVARGYLNRREKTAEVFIDNPFVTGDDGEYARIYKTGDIVRWLPDGNLQFVGRRDGQVKIRGFRIELREVEGVIKEFPGVKDVTVQAFDEEGGGKFIAAYVVAEHEVDVDALNGFILERKPPYMVPAATMQIDAIPLNQNQKVDKRALPKPVKSAAALERQSGMAAQNDLQRELVEMVGGIVHHTEFGIDTPLRFVGLTSISAIRLATTVYRRYGAILDAKNLVKEATVLMLEEAIKNTVASQPQQVEEVTVAPLSFSQTGVYVDCMNHPEDTQYNIPWVLGFPADTDSERLRRAVLKVLEAHKHIFVRFESEGDDIVQRFAPVSIDIPVLSMTDAEWTAHKQAFVRPFDLSRDVLCRMEIVGTESGVFLLLDVHHLVFDGSSLDLFIVQLCDVLEGRSVEAETYTHLNLAADQQGEPTDAHKAYYDSLLGTCEGATELPADLPTPQPCERSAECCRPIDMEAVEQFCRQHPVTPAHLTLAATLLVFARFTGTDDLYISTVSSGRSNIRIQNSFGMFVNTLPFAAKVGDGSVMDFIKDVSQRFDEAMRHEQYPYARIAADYGYTPELAFAYQLGMVTRYMQNGHEVSVESLEAGAPKFRLLVRIEIHDGQPCIVTEYDNGLYSESLVGQLTESVAHVLKTFINQPQSRLADVPLLSAEQMQLLDSFNRTDVPYDDSQTIVSLFNRQAKATPENIAVVYQETRLTYREVDGLSDRIAGYIASRGLGHEDVVSILIPRCEWMAIASLGVLKAGCAYQPLDPTYPKERLNFMMQDAGARLLIADEGLRDLVDEYRGEVLLTKDIADLPTAEPTATDDIAPDSLFILLYTSGSTGVPKGCMLTHRNVVAFCHWYQRYYNLDEHTRMTAYASYGFDANMMDTYPTLTSGGTVYIIPEEIRLDLVALNAYFSDNGITHAFMTTQVGYQFASSMQNDHLHFLSTGGEKLAGLQPPTDYQLVNIYGPTETTVCITAYRVNEAMTHIPIGTAIDNVHLYVVDKQGHRLPAGAVGELWVSGPQVARGYLNRPEKTAEVFIDNPFVSNDASPYSHIYKTGDIVRYLPDGNLQFVGRSDGQVKIRGFRIELKEVESVIREFPGIKDATVQAFDDDGGGKFVAAYIVSDEQVDIEALNNFILDQKPPYMVPAVTMQIDAIPLNQNQKVNKRALPKPVKSAGSAEQQMAQAPLNVLEKMIQEVVSQVIGTADFGITNLFRDFGLTSISSIKLAMLIYKRFNVQVNSRALITHGTIQFVENEILNAMLEGKEAEGERTDLDTAPKAADRHDTPHSCRLSFAQQGVYTECQANPNTVQYNIPHALTFPNEISAEQLAEAVRKVTRAHPYLLCHFTIDPSDEIIQEPMPDYTLEIPVRTLSAEELEAYKNEFVRPFDLEKGPCVRFEIIKSDRLTLLVDMHHLVSDGASVDLFFTQLTRALDGSDPQKEDYTYYDFVGDEKISPETETFFERQMAEVEEPTQLIPDVFVEHLPHTQKSVTAPTDIKAVKEFAQQHGITPAAVYLAACYTTFGRYVCEDTVSIVTVSNGRNNMKVWNTMGMFVNTLPLVTTLNHHEKTADFLRRVSDNFSQTIDNENYPFARIASKYDFHPSVSYTYQIGVINDYGTQYGKIAVEPLTLDIAKLPVSVYIEGSEQEAVIKVDYDSSMYSAEMMAGLAKCISNAARGLITCDNVSQISLTDESQWKVLDSFNKPWDLDFDRTDSVATRFKKIVGEYPDKTAVVFKDKAFTYQELDKLTDSLAAKIYKIGCEVTGKTDLKEEVAAIILPRNEQTFIMPLAAVKAGMGYEPLDPSYPKERLNFMVKDASVCLLIADDDLCNVVDEYKGKIVTVSELYSMEKADTPPVGPSPESLFIMLYTSGSTGAPKGCQIENRNIVAYAHGMRHTFYTKDDIVAAYASFSFDVNMADVFCSLLVGATVNLVPEEDRMDLGRLAAYFDKAGITTLLLTTQVGVQFAQNYPHQKTLRLLIIAGEKCPAIDPSAISYPIANGYGPTENCCGVSVFPIKEWEPNIPIGQPIPTIHAYVLDKTNHRLPAGAAGEYCLSGPQTSRGYLNRPDKTAEAYEDCPFNEFRMYHTGDIVRYRQNGDVEFVGRKDGQVKIRGFRIETKEVETVIRGFDGIDDVTVQAYDYESGGKYLAAFVVGSGTINTDALAEYVKSQKPAYMVPAVIMQIDKIPLTVNMKVDKKALPKPERKAADYVAPANKTEEDFCAIFSSVLGIDRISAEADFFEIGGSSILAMKVVIAAEKAGYKIVYNDVFTYTTPRAMAEFLGEHTEPEATAGEQAPLAYGEWTPPVVGADGYDYKPIHELLSHNTLEAYLSGEPNVVGDVLLLGATGYLGSHVLHELIKSYEGTIYCFVRPSKEESGENRLKAMQRYYFNDADDELYGSRIIVIEGDATDPASLQKFEAPHSDMTVINCAASVKHFAKGNEIERVNVESVKNLTAWCLRWGARLIHISTGSIMGSRKDGVPPISFHFTENVLYAGQELNGNQYIHSKFMAERHIYEEILANGLRAKVCRVGNLAPRSDDGEFQINYQTNSYMNSLNAFRTLGVIGYDDLNVETEFSPIDCVAKAVLALAQTPDDCICFQPLNPHRPLMGDVIHTMNDMGFSIRGAEGEEVAEALNKALADENTHANVGSLIAYNSGDGSQEIGLESLDVTYTSCILERLGFSWPETGTAYIRRFLEKLGEKGFFNH
ncbi:MAG: amino acid adenylation domain-containing protein [Bacteroidaceae bacterium]|nr:amino acid adenylation domain-containing protein [Bacteroidaceae bacterium]